MGDTNRRPHSVTHHFAPSSVVCPSLVSPPPEEKECGRDTKRRETEVNEVRRRRANTVRQEPITEGNMTSEGTERDM